jgi:hypothetical protein
MCFLRIEKDNCALPQKHSGAMASNDGICYLRAYFYVFRYSLTASVSERTV